jgi:hypothetical protein
VKAVLRDHKRPGDARKISGQALRHAIDEVFLLRLAAEIGEGQDHDGEAWRTRLFRCRSLRRGRLAAGLDRIGANRPRDVFEFLFSVVDEPSFIRSRTWR